MLCDSRVASESAGIRCLPRSIRSKPSRSYTGNTWARKNLFPSLSGIRIEVAMHEIHWDRKKTSFGPFEFVLPFALSEGEASDVGPGLDLLLSLRVEEIPFDHWSLAGLDPIAIEIPFQTAAATDVGRTEFLAFLCFRIRLRRNLRKREVRHRKG